MNPELFLFLFFLCLFGFAYWAEKKTKRKSKSEPSTFKADFSEEAEMVDFLNRRQAINELYLLAYKEVLKQRRK